jgi:hypothetical protein
MERELARKVPAEVVGRQLQLPRTEIMHAGLHERDRLLTRVHEMERRGEIGQAYTMREVRNGWAVKVVRIAERPNWWQRNGLRAALWGAGILTFLTLLVLLLRVLAVLLMAVLPILIGVALLIVVCVVLSSLGGSSIEVLQRVRIKR